MLFESPCRGRAKAARLCGEGEVVHARDAAHGVVDSVAFEPAVAEGFPGLHTGEDVLDAGAHLLVGLVVGFLPIGQVFAHVAAVWHDESGAWATAIGDRYGLC